jgi:hypothetical protein
MLEKIFIANLYAEDNDWLGIKKFNDYPTEKQIYDFIKEKTEDDKDCHVEIAKGIKYKKDNKMDCQNCKLHMKEIDYSHNEVGCRCSENRVEHTYSCINQKVNTENCAYCRLIK